MKASYSRRLIVLAAAAVCTHCAPSDLTPYQLGFRHGCVTGYSDSGRAGYESTFLRNEARFTSDDEYRRGWIDGEKKCYEREMNFPTMTFGDGGR
jgi:hypothetical protein